MKKELGKIYHDRTTKYSGDLVKVKNQINLIAFGRMTVVIIGSSLSIYLYYIELYMAVPSLLIFAFSFIYLIHLHNKMFRERLRASYLIQINQEEIARLKDGHGDHDAGSEFLELDHPYASDLDIFGNGSLFQYVNRTCGVLGRKCLASLLSQSEKELEIVLRQEAIIELKDKLDWRQEFQAIGRMSNESEQDLDSLMNWLHEPAYFADHNFYKILLIILPLLTLSLFILSGFLIPVGIPILFTLIQLGVIRVNLKKINNHHAQTTKKFSLLSKYQGLIKAIENENFVSEKLAALKNNLINPVSGKSAKNDIAGLSRIISDFDKRLHMIFGMILNGLLMWDLQCVLRLEKWRVSNKNEVEQWFKSIGEIDALSSLGCFYYNNPEFTMPEISNDNVVLRTRNLGHPLINQKERICNDIKVIELGKFMLITGSNMAGKSTFLRTIGINLVLAMSGAPTCAEYFKFYPIQIYTNMRILDSLISGESTFYAELKRLKTIINALDKGQKVLILFDEILTGTNSRDKHIGSVALIRQLIEKEAVGFIATHDLALANMAKQYPENISNYCFEVTIQDEKFIYDHKLKEGVCQTMNATGLMKKMGIAIDKRE